MVSNIPGTPPPVHNPTAVAQSQPTQIKDGVNQQTAVVQAKNEKRVKEEKEKKNSKQSKQHDEENEENESEQKPLITGTNIAFIQESLDNKKSISSPKGYDAYKIVE